MQWDEWLGGWDVQRVPWVAFSGQAEAHKVRDGVEDLTVPTEERAVVSPCCDDEGCAPGGVGDHLVGGGPDDVVSSGRGGSQDTRVGGPPGKEVDEDQLRVPALAD